MNPSEPQSEENLLDEAFAQCADETCPRGLRKCSLRRARRRCGSSRKTACRHRGGEAIVVAAAQLLGDRFGRERGAIDRSDDVATGDIGGAVWQGDGKVFPVYDAQDGNGAAG